MFHAFTEGAQFDAYAESNSFKFEWYVSKVSSRGWYSNWEKIGEKQLCNYCALQEGIFHVRLVITEKNLIFPDTKQEIDYKRMENDPFSGSVNVLKKGQLGCFGVVSTDKQKRLIKRSAEELGNEIYAPKYPNTTEGMAKLQKELLEKLVANGTSKNVNYDGSYKCNIFIFNMSNDIVGESNVKELLVSPITNKTNGKKLAPMVENWKKWKIDNWEKIMANTGGNSPETDNGWIYPEPGWLVFSEKHCGVLDYDGAWINATDANYVDLIKDAKRNMGVGRNYYLSDKTYMFAKHG